MTSAWVHACLLVSLLAAGCVGGDPGPGPTVQPARPDDDAPPTMDTAPPTVIPPANATNDTNETPPTNTTPPANATPKAVRLMEIADGFDAPVQVLEASDGTGRLYVVEQGGAVRAMTRDGEVEDEPFLALWDRVGAGGERGLLGLAVDPDDARRLYASYTDKEGDTKLARVTLDDDGDLVDLRELLHVDQPYPNHNGGLVLFGPDGMLYLGLGDGGSAGDPHENGQAVTNLLGKILRFDVSGDGDARPAPGNPYVGRDGEDEILHYGLRNPWRFSFDRESGDLYIGDVGQGELEEIDFAPAGATGLNFGWNAWEGSREFGGDLGGPAPATFPVAEYAQDDTGGCAVTGGYVYRGGALPHLVGKYVYGDYCAGTIWTLERDAGEWSTRKLLDTDLRITSFGEDADGELYVVHHGGSIHRLVADS